MYTSHKNLSENITDGNSRNRYKSDGQEACPKCTANNKGFHKLPILNLNFDFCIYSLTTVEKFDGCSLYK